MPRVRGPMAARPEGDGPLLNARLFGDHDRGGYDVAVSPDALPWSWPATFGREAPLTLEIGFNRGKFLSELAQAWPDHDHVGIEVSRRFAWRLHHLLSAHGPENVRIVWADARAATPALFQPGSLQAVFINFPDPWWKKRHHKRRLVQGPFAAQLAELLAPGGRVWVKSDVADIAAEIDESLAAVPAFGDRTTFGVDDLPLTFREVRCVRTGLPIHRFHYTRQG